VMNATQAVTVQRSDMSEVGAKSEVPGARPK
jgi:hypothetical protein